ncbi:uncharacterized protein N7484_002155 [Penicillium longicatenatum]|uniref:uncharacterized protein n=1 Tax=Penicillium longicatenatum TaxID=1561947 RepID=UPI0025468611|nr:uncharacterized protein N7484_002155 [Penicillium longicatenatum]KAJ5658506.1 hypothetical protein N7484_002155 [Penicillium longicatenatum]
MANRSSKTTRALEEFSGSSNCILKRPKLRKGTTSCWECKRRKKRCEFGAESTTCDICQRLRLPCISQDLADPVHDDDRLGHRLDHVEALVTQLVRQRNVQSNTELGRTRESDIPTLRSVSHERLSRGWSLTGYLYSVLPDPSTAAVILNSINLFSSPLQISQSKPGNSPPHTRPSQDSLSLTSHPVLFARRLVQLAVCLKQFNELSSEQLKSRLNESIHDAAKRYFTAASHFVTSQDFLVASLDGLETLMLQGGYHITNGDFQAAWAIQRRAANISQVIDLPNLAKEPGSRSENLWFRIIYSDRFLSLILGFPFTVADNTFASAFNLAANAPAQRLERIHAYLAGCIIARNLQMQKGTEFEESFLYEHYAETKRIDGHLKKATRILPNSWWLAPSLDTVLDGKLERTAKLLVQMHQYYLLVHLHQPYTIHNQNVDLDRDYTYSKLTAVSASREVLLRYLILRDHHRSPSYRALDEKAFMASVTILFAHFVGHESASANLHEHQRSSDLGTIEKVIDLFEKLSITLEASGLCGSKILRKFMEIEEDAANGSLYRTWNGIEASTDTDKERSDRCVVQIPIPYFGVIFISGQLSIKPLTTELNDNTESNSSESEFYGPLSPLDIPRQSPIERATSRSANRETDTELFNDWIHDAPTSERR